MFLATHQAIADRLNKLSSNGDPLVKLNEIMDWKIFIPLLERIFKKERKSLAGRKPYPLLVMFKILILQCLYNLSDYQAEYQIRDRLSFMRFLGLNIQDAVSDEKTCLDFLLDDSNSDKKVWGDCAYYSCEKERLLKERGYESRIILRNKKYFPSWSNKSRENTRRSKIRVRVEHVFGFIKNTMRAEIIRGIGIARISARLGLINLVYNFCRFEQINRLGIA